MCSAQKFKKLCFSHESFGELNNILNSLFDPNVDLKASQRDDLIKYISGGLDFELFKEKGIKILKLFKLILKFFLFHVS